MLQTNAVKINTTSSQFALIGLFASALSRTMALGSSSLGWAPMREGGAGKLADYFVALCSVSLRGPVEST